MLALRIWILIQLILSTVLLFVFFIYDICVVALEYYVENYGLAVFLTVLYLVYPVLQFHGMGTGICYMKELRIQQALERVLAKHGKGGDSLTYLVVTRK